MPRATVVMYYRFIFFRTHEKTKLLHSRKKCGIVNIGPRRISPHSLQVFEDAAFNRKIGNHGIVNPSCICHRIRRVLFPIVIDIHGKTISLLFQIGCTGYTSCLCPCRIQCGKQHRRQNGDDRNYDEKLDQCENIYFHPAE